jgi:hypothetical protein
MPAMRAMRSMRSMAHSDDELYDMAKARAGLGNDDLPEFPLGLRFTVREPSFETLGIDDALPGAAVKFAALARATNVSRRTDGCRIEAEIDMLALDGGKMAELDDTARPSICLDENDHDRLDLDEDCERGDMLHLIGMARVESVDDTEYGGKAVTLQITHASVENEDMEAGNA